MKLVLDSIRVKAGKVVAATGVAVERGDRAESKIGAPGLGA